jgi:serine protease Do
MKRELVITLFAVVSLTCLGVIGCRRANTQKISTEQNQERARVDRAVAAVYPALVRIYVVGRYHSGGREKKGISAGSGTIISPEGHVLTNHHVAGKAKYIWVTLSNREEVEAELIGSDALSDLAIIKLKPETMRKPVKSFPVAEFGDSSKLRVGDVVMAMGSPGAISQSVTKGIVANTAMILPGGGTRLDGERVGSVVRWIAHDSQIFHGNSGGPLVNLDGKLIGVNEIGVAALGGAIPSNLAKYVAGELIKHGRVRRSSIGIEPRPLLKCLDRVTGVMVNCVVPKSPAALAGIKAGDIILEYSGKAVTVRWGEEMPVFNRMVLETPVGSKVAIKYLRGSKEKTVELLTVERGPARDKDGEIRSWGATMRDLTVRGAREMKRSNTDGVLISSVRPGGGCGSSKPRIVPGDVIVKVGSKEVKNLNDLKAFSSWITAGKKEAVPTLVVFDRKTQRMMTSVKIGPEEDNQRTPEVRKAWFPAAVQVFTRELAKVMKLPKTRGVLITQIYPKSNAVEAGFKLGDIITHLDGTKIDASQPEDGRVFPTMIRRYRIGSQVEMSVLRDGTKMKIKVKLPRSPVPPGEMERYRDIQFEFGGRDVAFIDRARRKWKQEQKGVFIESVDPGGWAALAGLSVGDLLLKVNGVEVNGASGIKARMKELSKEKPRFVVFFVRRGVHTRYLEFEPDWTGR